MLLTIEADFSVQTLCPGKHCQEPEVVAQSETLECVYPVLCNSAPAVDHFRRRAH